MLNLELTVFPFFFCLLFGIKVVDCRICGDPNSVLRFAFIEFTDEGTFEYLRHRIYVDKHVLIVNEMCLQMGLGLL